MPEGTLFAVEARHKLIPFYGMESLTQYTTYNFYYSASTRSTFATSERTG